MSNLMEQLKTKLITQGNCWEGIFKFRPLCSYLRISLDESLIGDHPWVVTFLTIIPLLITVIMFLTICEPYSNKCSHVYITMSRKGNKHPVPNITSDLSPLISGLGLFSSQIKLVSQALKIRYLLPDLNYTVPGDLF